MNSSFLVAVADHLWQSTLFALAAAGLTLALRRNSARIRWFVWLAASVKFLVPFALLTTLGAQFPWSSGPVQLTPGFLATAGHTVARVTQITGAPVVALGQSSHASTSDFHMLIILEVAWALGTFLVAARWLRRWLVLQRVLRGSTLSALPFDIPVRSAAGQLEPAVLGVLRPVLLLPVGLEGHLSAEELDAVLAHEHCHVIWRDNLAATSHMTVEALFWFHPLVWWLGKRMVEERERACDERVLAQGHVAGSYAEAILKVCEHYLQSPLSTAAGVGGGRLSQRIAAIMQNRLVERLGIVRKMALTMAACTVLAIPLAIGTLSAPYATAVAATAAESVPALRNVSIKPPPTQSPDQPGAPEGSYITLVLAEDGHERIRVAYSSLRGFVATAYGVNVTQVVGEDLSKQPKFIVTADNPWPEKPTDSGAERIALHQRLSDEAPAMMRNLLTTRFGVVVKHEKRQMDGYVLTVGHGGSTLRPDTNASFIDQGMGQSDRELIATMEPTGLITYVLEEMFHVPVVDQTGLKGTYDFKLTWTPAPAGTTPSPATMAAALEELGLHLEAKPVTVDVINVVGMKSPEQVLASK